MPKDEAVEDYNGKHFEARFIKKSVEKDAIYKVHDE